MEESPTPIKVEMEVEIPEEVYSDILITAFDGSYGGVWQAGWAEFKRSVVDHSDDNEIWRAVTIYVPDLGTEFLVNREVLARGIQRLLHAYRYVEHIGQLIMDADASMIDAGIADSIVQLGLFGEERYG